MNDSTLSKTELLIFSLPSEFSTPIFPVAKAKNLVIIPNLTLSFTIHILFTRRSYKLPFKFYL